MIVAAEKAQQFVAAGDFSAAIRTLETRGVADSLEDARAVVELASEIRGKISKRREQKRCDSVIAYAQTSIARLSGRLPIGTPSGWYADPAGTGMSRFWSGLSWTENLSSVTPRDVPSPDPDAAIHQAACPSCGGRYPDIELRPDDSVFCRVEQRVVILGLTGPSPAIQDPPSEQVVQGSIAGTKICPRCAEEVKLAAEVCRFCGHDFSGQTAEASQSVPQPQTTSGAAIASFITSLLGLWIAGIPLGIHAQRSIDGSNGRLIGRGFATAGIVLGLIGIIGTVILIVALG